MRICPPWLIIIFCIVICQYIWFIVLMECYLVLEIIFNPKSASLRRNTRWHKGWKHSTCSLKHKVISLFSVLMFLLVIPLCWHLQNTIMVCSNYTEFSPITSPGLSRVESLNFLHDPFMPPKPISPPNQNNITIIKVGCQHEVQLNVVVHVNVVCQIMGKLDAQSLWFPKGISMRWHSIVWIVCSCQR